MNRNINTLNSLRGNHLVPVAQTHTGGATLTINQTTDIVHIDPALVIASLELTLPAPVANGHKIRIDFGGTIAVGNAVVTTLSFANGTTYGAPTTASGADSFELEWDLEPGIWRVR